MKDAGCFSVLLLAWSLLDHQPFIVRTCPEETLHVPVPPDSGRCCTGMKHECDWWEVLWYHRASALSEGVQCVLRDARSSLVSVLITLSYFTDTSI